MIFCDIWPWKVKFDSSSEDSEYSCYMSPRGPNFAYFGSMTSPFRNKWHFLMHDLVITLKDQLWLGSTRQPGYMLHAPTGPKFCLFLLYHKRFLRKVVFFYVRPSNDLKMANVTRVHQTVNIHATCPCRAQILLIFALQQAISEISDILGCTTLKWPWKVKCDSGPPYTCYMYPRSTHFVYFYCTTSGFWDKWHFVMRNL